MWDTGPDIALKTAQKYVVLFHSNPMYIEHRLTLQTP